MAATKYTYSISADFPNAKVSSDRLSQEIQDAAITIALDYISNDASNSDIWFKNAISAGEKTTLDAVVAAHDGTPLPDNEVSEVLIQEENVKTGGRFQAKGVQLGIPATTGWTEIDVSWPIAVSLLSAAIQGEAANQDDEGEVLVGPDTIIGTITANIVVDDTTIFVSQSVIDNIEVGYWVKINSEDFGRCLAVDKVNLTIDVENAAVGTHTAGDYVKQTVKLGYELSFGSNGIDCVGESKIGGSYIPANTVIRVRHNNISATAKNFNVRFEYLY